MKFPGHKNAVPRTPGSGGFIDFGPYGTKVRLNSGFSGIMLDSEISDLVHWDGLILVPGPLENPKKVKTKYNF